MIRSIIANETCEAVSRTLTGKLTNCDVDGLIFSVKTSGTDVTRAHFDSVIVNATLRVAGGDDLNIVAGCRMSDLLKMSDYMGGLSMVQLGDAIGEEAAYLPLGKIVISGDDILEIQIQVPGDATMVQLWNVGACDFVKAYESITGYETVPGNGSEILFKAAHTVYLTSAYTGAQIAVTDQERSYIIDDHLAAAYANATGKFEKWEDFAGLWSDGSGLGQDVRIKVPSGAYALVVKGFAIKNRQAKKDKEIEEKVKSIENKIKIENPQRAEALAEKGAVRG